ncbi:MAG: DNA primase [bacterium]
MRFDEGFLDQVRAATDIVEVIGPYVKLKKKGQNWFGLCPFHNEKTPSFSVHQERGMYYCFGCGAGGNAITFLMEHDGMSFTQAVEDLAKRAGIPLPKSDGGASTDDRDRLRAAVEAAASFFQQNLKEDVGRKAVDYLKERGMTGETARDFRLGYAPDSWDALLKHLKRKGYKEEELQEAGLVKPREGGGHYDAFRDRIVFPFIDRRGRVIGFSGRLLSDDEEAGPKYINSPETPLFQKGRVLYGLHQAVKNLLKSERALLVEGQFDVLTLHQEGLPEAVAASGTAFTEDQARMLQRLVERVLLLFDADSAGLKAAWRSYTSLVSQGLDVAFVPLPEGEDPDTLVREEGVETFRERLEGAQTVVSFFLDHLDPPLESRDAHGRAEAARDLLEMIRNDSDGLRRTMTLQEIAGRFGLEEADLRRELEALEKSRPTFRGPDETRQPLGDSDFRRMPALEADLLRLVMTSAAARRRLLAGLEPDDLHHPAARGFFETLASEAGEDGTVDWDRMLEQGSPDQRGLAAWLLQEEVSALGLSEEERVTEFLNAIEGRRKKHQRRRLRESIEQARLAGDEATLAKLLKEYQEMYK